MAAGQGKAAPRVVAPIKVDTAGCDRLTGVVAGTGSGGLAVHLTGPAAHSAGAFDGILLYTTLIVAAVLLLVTYRSPGPLVLADPDRRREVNSTRGLGPVAATDNTARWLFELAAVVRGDCGGTPVVGLPGLQDGRHPAFDEEFLFWDNLTFNQQIGPA